MGSWIAIVGLLIGFVPVSNIVVIWQLRAHKHENANSLTCTAKLVQQKKEMKKSKEHQRKKGGPSFEMDTLLQLIKTLFVSCEMGGIQYINWVNVIRLKY